MMVGKSNMKGKNTQIFAYLVVGGLTTVISWITFALCNYLNKPTIFSQICSFVVAVVFAYITDKTFVFESKSWGIKKVVEEFSTFLFARVFSFVIETVFMLLVVDVLLVNSLIAKLIITIFIMAFNYIVSKKCVFKKSKK